MSIPQFFRLLSVDLRREIRRLSGVTRCLLLVVAALWVRMSFQIVLSPPLGVWKDNGRCNSVEVGGGSSDTILVCEHKAGTAIALEKAPYFWLFLLNNSLMFGISSSLMLLVVLNGRMKLLCLGLNLTLCFSYFNSVLAITDDKLLSSCLACFSALFSILAVLLTGTNG